MADWAIKAHDLEFATTAIIGPFNAPDDVLDYMYETLDRSRYIDPVPIKLTRPTVVRR